MRYSLRTRDGGYLALAPQVHQPLLLTLPRIFGVVGDPDRATTWERRSDAETVADSLEADFGPIDLAFC